MNLGGGGTEAGAGGVGLQYCAGGGGGSGGDGGGRVGGGCWLHGFRQGHSPHFMLGLILIESSTLVEYVTLVAMGISNIISNIRLHLHVNASIVPALSTRREEKRRDEGKVRIIE